LDDYRKLPNGLGLLCREQGEGNLTQGTIVSAFTGDPLMETCLIWLKAEEGEKKFDPASAGIKRDPMDGQPLRIDLKERLIRSIGADSKLGELEKPTEWTGFRVVAGDPALKVPRWQNER
jgi:hypothetical protein